MMLRAALLTGGALASAAMAQNSTAPQTIPGLDRFNLPGQPTPTPTPAPIIAPLRPPIILPSPTPSPTAAPTATPAPAATPTARSTIEPRVTVTPRTANPARTPTTTPTPTPAASPAAPAPAPIALPTPQSSVSPVPAASPTSVVEGPIATPAEGGSWRGWAAGALAALLAVLVGGVWYWRRRKRSAQDSDSSYAPLIDVDARPMTAAEADMLTPEAEIAPVEAAPEPIPAPSEPTVPPAPSAAPQFLRRDAVPPPPEPAPPPVAEGPRATLAIALTVKRAGTNLTGAASEYDVTIRNTGDVAATGIRLDIRMATAGPQQDELIDALYAQPIDRPQVPPFDLPPGGETVLGGMGMLPKDMVTVMTANERALFVPVLTVNLRYGWDGGEGQNARAFMIGIDRGDGSKLAPFRLDTMRMHDRIGAIEYTRGLDR